MSNNLFGARKRGEDGYYSPDKDFLYCTPELLVKGAAYAADSSSWIYSWLKSYVPEGKVVEFIKKDLQYLLVVLDDCRANDLTEVFDPSQVNTHVYQAIMMGMGAMVLRKFNRLFREYRFTDLKTKGVSEPIRGIDHLAALSMFNDLVSKTV